MRIGVIGAGNIGQTLKAMLASVGGVTEITLADNAGQGDVHVDAGTGENLAAFVHTHDAIVNALPFYLNKTVASACAEARRSYFDFSEDIESTKFVSDLARGFKEIVFVPQCGLAPGAINIIGAHLISQFETARSLELRVGALPLSANNEIKYYLSWSSSGLINEYIKPCDALFRGRPVKTLPLDGKENLVIDGVTYEAFNTSGGVGTMCETYSGSIGLTGREVFDISGITAGVASGFAQSRRLAVRARRADGSATDFEVSARIETPQEVLYVRHGRILQYVLRQLLGARSEHVPTPARNRIRFLPPIMTGRWTKALSSPFPASDPASYTGSTRV
jgi:saccharopine dehydrogenase-like NADP-dependent oxidoreductase